jgi:hypothetical protein
LTETAPVVSVNTAKHNRPGVGPRCAVWSYIGARIAGARDNVMAGYWRDEWRTRAVLDTELVSHRRSGAYRGRPSLHHGRRGEIIVLANAEVPRPIWRRRL